MMVRFSKYLLVVAILLYAQMVAAANPNSPPQAVERVAMSHKTGHIEVEVYLNNQGPFLFLLDTGASGDGRIDSRLSKKLGLSVIGKTLNDDGTGRNLKVLDQVQIDSLRIGDKQFYDLTVIVQDYQKEQTTDVTIDGILGLGLFENILLTIDYPKSELKLVNGELSEESPNTSSYNRGQNGQCCLVPVKIGRNEFMAILDTGNQGGFTVPRRFLNEVMIDGQIERCGYAKTTNNSFTLYQAQLVHPLEFGGHAIPGVKAMCARGWKTPNLGHQNLNRFAITIDQKNQLIQFLK